MAQQGDAGAMVSRQSAIFPLEAHVIIAMMYQALFGVMHLTVINTDPAF